MQNKCKINTNINTNTNTDTNTIEMQYKRKKITYHDGTLSPTPPVECLSTRDEVQAFGQLSVIPLCTIALVYFMYFLHFVYFVYFIHICVFGPT